ncbi:MAG: alkaline phosphatase family protein [Gemmatimonadales bacterium]
MLTCLTLLAFLGACAARSGPGDPTAEQARPALVVMITVDQLRADYLDRWKGQYTGGLKRLLDEGAVYLNGHQDHAITETAPGHSTLLSGRFPRNTGITRNLAGVNTPGAPLVSGTGAPASPSLFRGTTLVDWMTAVDPRTKVLSVSFKDRGAILPIGRSKQEVYWWSASGFFTTSRWYRDALPDWVKQFNATAPRSYAGREWNLLLDPSKYAEPDSVPVESRGRGFLFPYRLSAAPDTAAAQLPGFPFMDEVIGAMALRGVEALGLGTGSQTDVLAVSFSTTDLIGHRFGPDSREIHDQVVRLDRVLGVFIDSLAKLRGAGRLVLALTGDHGVTPFPELHNGRVTPAPVRVDMGPALRAAAQVVTSARGNVRAVDFESGALLIERDSLGVDLEHLGAVVRTTVDSFLAVARRIPGVLRAERHSEIPRDPSRQDAISRRWTNMFPSDVPVEAVVTLTPGSYWHTVFYALHGTPHDSDSNVPIVFWGAGVKPGRHDTFARTVDIAPTLAQLLDVQPTEQLDGRPLTAVFR